MRPGGLGSLVLKALCEQAGTAYLVITDYDQEGHNSAHMP